MTPTPTTTSRDIDRIVAIVVEAVQPLRVVLFGSAARDEMRPDSDIDLMVVMPDGTSRLQVAKQLYSLGIPDVDFVVSTPEIFDRLKDSASYVHYDIAREGRELYAA